MLELEIIDMPCGHCVASITKAVENVAPEASLEFDLPTHRVKISQATDAAAIELAIREAGFDPVKVS